MELLELAFGVALVLVLTGVAIYFGWRQRQTMALLQQDIPASVFEREFLRGQVRRRLLCSVLLVMFAAVLLGWLLFMDGHFRQLRPLPGAEEAVLDDYAKEWLRFYLGYWIFAMVLLMVIIALAGVDFLATARYGLAHKKKLLRDQQTVLAMEVARLRLKRQE